MSLSTVSGELAGLERPTFVFDLGRVLVDFDFEPAFAKLHRWGFAPQTVEEASAAIRLAEYECGLISTREFLDNLRSLVSNEVSEEELVDCYQQIFRPDWKMFEFVRNLRSSYRVVALSNTSDLHLRYLKSQYEIDELFETIFASFELKLRKPDPLIYRRVLEGLASVQPSQLIFVDDLHENVEAARSLGLWGVVHESAEKTKGEIGGILSSAFDRSY